MSSDGILAPREQCVAVWRRLVSHVDPDINFADRVLASRRDARNDDEGELLSEDVFGNKLFRCTRYDTELVDCPSAKGEMRKLPLCGAHQDIPALWKAENEAMGQN